MYSILDVEPPKVLHLVHLVIYIIKSKSKSKTKTKSKSKTNWLETSKQLLTNYYQYNFVLNKLTNKQGKCAVDFIYFVQKVSQISYHTSQDWFIGSTVWTKTSQNQAHKFSILESQNQQRIYIIICIIYITNKTKMLQLQLLQVKLNIKIKILKNPKKIRQQMNNRDCLFITVLYQRWSCGKIINLFGTRIPYADNGVPPRRVKTIENGIKLKSVDPWPVLPFHFISDYKRNLQKHTIMNIYTVKFWE